MSHSLKDGSSNPICSSSSSSTESVKIDESLAAPESNIGDAQTELGTVVSVESQLENTDDPEKTENTAENSSDAELELELKLEAVPQFPSSPSFCCSLTYKMNHVKRGLCLILNQSTFDKDMRLSERKGSDVDADNLKRRFEQLGFEVLLLHNLPCLEIERLLRKIAKQDHSNEDCFACCILSHGEQGDLLYGRDGTVHIPDLLAPFKGDVCKSLAGKPKLFFIQACRGTKLDHGVFIPEEILDDVTDSARAREVRIPSEADFLVAYSAVPGHYSWRNAVRGSWFVQALCEVFANFADKMDLLSMMTLVNAKVAYDFESQIDDPSMKHKKQIPCVVSMLTKQVWLIAKKHEANS